MADQQKQLLIGTSGWGYDEWVGPFYPKGLTPSDYLDYYSKIFYTNEINTTFYQIPPRNIVVNWAKHTPSEFRFTAKLPRTITHKHKLNCDECLTDLDNYLWAMEPLIQTGKLLSFLIQLPPSFEKKQHFEDLIQFVDSWPEDRETMNYFLTVEFRNKSWMDEETFRYLKKNSLTYCVVIEPLLPPRMDITNTEFAYIRFHGYGNKIWFDYEFSEGEIKEWSEKVESVINGAERVGIYFNNHFSGYAAKNAIMMAKELNIPLRTDPKRVDVLKIKKQSGTVSKDQTSLDNFF